jgi:hypothetical protein
MQWFVELHTCPFGQSALLLAPQPSHAHPFQISPQFMFPQLVEGVQLLQ